MSLKGSVWVDHGSQGDRHERNATLLARAAQGFFWTVRRSPRSARAPAIYDPNQVDLQVRNSDGEVYFEVEMYDTWVWDMYRPARFVKNVRVMTFKDVNIEELEKPDISLPTDSTFGTTR